MKNQKLLNGRDVAEFIKFRHSEQARKAQKPIKLAIIQTTADEVTNIYLRIKQNYASDIGVDTEIHRTNTDKALVLINELNMREDINGIILQLPIDDMSKVDQLLNAISSAKDVDGLAEGSKFDPPTAVAIQWLLSAYNIEVMGKKIVVLGQGRLVGGPLTNILKLSGLDVIGVDDQTKDLHRKCLEADILICATGVPGLVKTEMVKSGAVIIDAGTATDNGEVVGDVSEEVRSRQDISITPIKGGVGPLTVAALFENLLKTI